MTSEKLPQIHNFLNLKGHTYGWLEVIEYAGNDPRPKWKCRCKCGKELIVRTTNLRSGSSKSCGCFSVSNCKVNFTKHGATKGYRRTPEYIAWVGMRSRCNGIGNSRYENYGARGITVCERWDSFENFLSDMGKKPTKNHSIDRIDVDGNYCPENCRWATIDQQSMNKGMLKNNTSGTKGVAYNRYKGKWQATYKNKHLGSFDDKRDAIAARKRAEDELIYDKR